MATEIKLATPEEAVRIEPGSKYLLLIEGNTLFEQVEACKASLDKRFGKDTISVLSGTALKLYKIIGDE